jgi:hypothetical protein
VHRVPNGVGIGVGNGVRDGVGICVGSGANVVQRRMKGLP